MKYFNEFFRTRDEAKSFVNAGTNNKNLGQGCIYKMCKKASAKSSQSYLVERNIHNTYSPHDESWYAERPFCVAWNRCE